jgi:hypothetical protein
MMYQTSGRIVVLINYDSTLLFWVQNGCIWEGKYGLYGRYRRFPVNQDDSGLPHWVLRHPISDPRVTQYRRQTYWLDCLPFRGTPLAVSRPIAFQV